MAYSNRRSHRPDPTVAPVMTDPVTGMRYLRTPFSSSAYQEARYLTSAAGRKATRSKARQSLKASHR